MPPDQTFQDPAGASSWQQILGPLLQMFSPQEAEAKVIPRDQASTDLVNAIQEGWTMAGNAKEQNPLVRGTFDPLKKQIFQEVLRAAQARPEETGVSYTKENVGAHAYFDPQTNEIRLQDRGLRTEAGRYPQVPPTAIYHQNTLTHELLHFLQKVLPPALLARGDAAFPDLGKLSWLRRQLTLGPGQDDLPGAFGSERKQHELIGYLLGGERSPADLGEYDKQIPFTTPPVANGPMNYLYRGFVNEIFKDPQLRERALSGLKESP